MQCCLLYLSFRYAYPWWREKEIVSEERRSQGLCPLTPEESALILQALGFSKDTQIYIAAGEIYGKDRRLALLRAAFPGIVSQFPELCTASGCETLNLLPDSGYPGFIRSLYKQDNCWL